MTRKRNFRFLALLFAIVVASVANAAGPGATITYRKVFKSSYPEFIEINVDQSGSGTYDIRQLSDPASPQPFRVDASLAQRIFSLAAKLNNFQGVDLEVHKRLASLGQKTFRYQDGAVDNQVTFNYTLDPTGTELSTIFQDLAQQETDLSDLTRTMRYDHLGVNDVVQQIESDFGNHLLLDPGAFVPTLEKLAADATYIDIARARARKLADEMRAASSQATQ